MGRLGFVAICNMRGFLNAFRQTLRFDLQADFSGVQPVAARSNAGFVGHLATCHIGDPSVWLLHLSKIVGSYLSCHICFGLYMGIPANAPSLPFACK